MHSLMRAVSLLGERNDLSGSAAFVFGNRFLGEVDRPQEHVKSHDPLDFHAGANPLRDVNQSVDDGELGRFFDEDNRVKHLFPRNATIRRGKGSTSDINTQQQRGFPSAHGAGAYSPVPHIKGA